MHPGDAQTVAGHADEAHQTLVSGCHHGLDDSTGSVSDFELVVFDQVVQLDEVDVVYAQPLQRFL